MSAQKNEIIPGRVRVGYGRVGCYWVRRYTIILRIAVTVRRYASSEQTLHGERVGTGRWVLIGG